MGRRSSRDREGRVRDRGARARRRGNGRRAGRRGVFVDEGVDRELRTACECRRARVATGRARAGRHHGDAPARPRDRAHQPPSARRCSPTATFVVVSTDVSDPGNVGTIVRTAEAAGADAVGQRAARSTRSTRSACEHPPERSSTSPSSPTSRRGELRGFGLAPDVGTSRIAARRTTTSTFAGASRWCSAAKPTALGRRRRSTSGCDPHAGRAESLNVAMAATVLVFEACAANAAAVRASRAGDAQAVDFVAPGIAGGVRRSLSRRLRVAPPGGRVRSSSEHRCAYRPDDSPMIDDIAQARGRALDASAQSRRSTSSRASRPTPRQEGALGRLKSGSARSTPTSAESAGQALNEAHGASRGAPSTTPAQRARSAPSAIERLASERLDLTEVADRPARGHAPPRHPGPRPARGRVRRPGLHGRRGPRGRERLAQLRRAQHARPSHPARSMWDTLYVDYGEPGSDVLRTHTSPVQIRVMQTQPPPIYTIMPGRVFRQDTADATHMPVFHQIEGLVIDEGITFGDLAGTIDAFTKAYFGARLRSRLRPVVLPVHRAVGRVRHPAARRLVARARRLRHGAPQRAPRLRPRSRGVAGLRVRVRHRPLAPRRATASTTCASCSPTTSGSWSSSDEGRCSRGSTSSRPIGDDVDALGDALNELGMAVDDVDRRRSRASTASWSRGCSQLRPHPRRRPHPTRRRRRRRR